MLYCTLDHRKVSIVNIYAPNNDNPNFFESLFKEVSKFTPQYTIYGGDINLVMDVNMDKKGGTLTTHDKSRQKLTSHLSASDMCDIWRECNPDVEGYTWRRLRPSRVCVRLDYFFASVSMMQFVTRCEIVPSFMSDHSMVVTTFHFSFTIRGPSYWKFNVSLLRDREYLDRINSLLRWSSTNNMDPPLNNGSYSS